MPSARTQSHITTVTPTRATTALIAIVAWSVGITLFCVDLSSASVNHPLIYLIFTVAGTTSTATIVCPGHRHDGGGLSAEIPAGVAAQIWDLAERATISRLN